MREMNAVWLIFIAAFAISFAVLEAWGWYKYGSPGTLSAHVRVWTYEEPLLIFLLGILVGWLAYHFWNATDMAKVAAEVTKQ